MIIPEPPAALLTPCDLPTAPAPKTNGELVDGYMEWRRSARECAAGKAQLIEWHRAAK